MVSISGLPGSGTTTAAELLAEKTGLQILSSGELFREMAEERDMSLGEFSELAEDNEGIDRKLDERMIERAEKGKILEGRLTGHLIHESDKEAYKVWLKASLDVRVRRITDRENADEVEKMRKRVKKRERSERKRYKDYYGIDLLDTSIYDLIIDSEENSPEEIVEEIMEGAMDEICEG